MAVDSLNGAITGRNLLQNVYRSNFINLDGTDTKVIDYPDNGLLSDFSPYFFINGIENLCNYLKINILTPLYSHLIIHYVLKADSFYNGLHLIFYTGFNTITLDWNTGEKGNVVGQINLFASSDEDNYYGYDWYIKYNRDDLDNESTTPDFRIIR